MNSSSFHNVQQSVTYSQFLNSNIGQKPVGGELAYDGRFQTFYYVNKKNSYGNIFVSRTSWARFERKEFHPALTNFALSYDDFNNTVSTLEKKVSKFFWIRFLYTLMVIILLAGICCFLFAAYMMPDLGEKEKDIKEENEISDIFFLMGAGVCLGSILIFTLLVNVLLNLYTKKLEKALIEENVNCKPRGLFWRVGKNCKYLQIEFLANK